MDLTPFHVCSFLLHHWDPLLSINDYPEEIDKFIVIQLTIYFKTYWNKLDHIHNVSSIKCTIEIFNREVSVITQNWNSLILINEYI